MTAAIRVLGTGLALLVLLTLGCGRRDESVPLTVEISPLFGADPLRLQQVYSLADGDSLSVDRLRYYLSNFRLHRADGSWATATRSDGDARGYFLVDAADAASQVLQVEGIAAGLYDGIEFLIGVDPARNTQGAQTGVLDPARGMFWTWNTGYVFFKLEGHSPQSTASEQSVTFHIGGNQPSLARTVYLPLGEKSLRLDAKVSGTVHLHFDVAAIFAGATALRLAEHNNIMEPAQGVIVADRYVEGFRLDHIHQEPRR